MMLSPERDPSFSHLMLPPIRDASLREDSLGSASVLSSRLVLPSVTDTLLGLTTDQSFADHSPRESFPHVAEADILGPSARSHPSTESTSSPKYLQNSTLHHHRSQQLYDTRHDANPFAFSEYANPIRPPLHKSETGSATSPLQIHGGTGGESSRIRGFGSPELSPRGYIMSAPPTAIQDSSPRHTLVPQRETFYSSSRSRNDFQENTRSVTNTRYSNAHSSAQSRRPRTSHDVGTSRSSDHAYHPPDMHPYYSANTQSSHMSAPSYSPVFTTERSSTFDGPLYQRDSRHWTGPTVRLSESIHEQGTMVDLERRCEEASSF